jgi:hypothetical protein
MMIDDLLKKLEDSDRAGALELIEKEIKEEGRAWEIHLSLFPLVQRVLNPPYINPHLPKMYRIYREFVPYLREEEIPPLLRLEISEYARRPKSEKIPPLSSPAPALVFEEVELAIRERDREKTAALMRSFLDRQGGAELARRLLLLGSGYLDQSLGHSVSCTAFILLEMMEHTHQDPWPALVTLADYFCQGGFHTTPALLESTPPYTQETVAKHLLRAASGRGIINLHHTITLYAIDRVRGFLDKDEYAHMIGAWIEFLRDKPAQMTVLDRPGRELPSDYPGFFQAFSRLDEKAVLAGAAGMMASEKDRRKLGRYLIKGVGDLYQGNYNPHFLTGLGSALWVVDRYGDRMSIVLNALAQYVGYFFEGLVD